MLVARAAQQAKGLFLGAVLIYRRCIALHVLCARALQRHIVLVQASMADHVQEDHMRLFEVLDVLWIPGDSSALMKHHDQGDDALYRKASWVSAKKLRGLRASRQKHGVDK